MKTQCKSSRMKIVLIGAVILALASLIFVASSASARYLSDEFSVRGIIPLSLWVSDIASEESNQKFAVTWLSEETEGGLLYPYFGWYSNSGWSTSWRLSDYPLSSSSSYPQVDCSYSIGCMVTWVVGGQVYAQSLTSLGYESAIWTVNLDGKALSSNVVAGSSRFIVTWTTTDDKVAMRYVSGATGPEGSVITSIVGGGCTLSTPNLVYSAANHTVGMVYGCLMQGTGYIRVYDDNNSLAYLWGDTITIQASNYVYSPDIAADKDGNYFVVWKNDLSSSARLYGQCFNQDGSRLGGVFALQSSSAEQADPRPLYDSMNNAYVVIFKQANNIYYARFRADGAPVGGAYAITTADGEQLAPVAAYDAGSEQSLVMWVDRRGFIETIWGRWLGLERLISEQIPFSNEVGEAGEAHYFQIPAQTHQWQALGLRPSAISDFDLHLFDSPDFSSELASSKNGTGTVDIVVMNGHQASQPGYFPLVQNYSGDTYVIENAPHSEQITQDNPNANASMSADSVITLYEVYASADQLLDIQVFPGVADLGVALFDPAQGAHQGIWDAAASADQNGAGQAESISFLPAQSGWMAVVVWKNDDSADDLVVISDGAGKPASWFYLPLVKK